MHVTGDALHACKDHSTRQKSKTVLQRVCGDSVAVDSNLIIISCRRFAGFSVVVAGGSSETFHTAR